LIDGFFDLRAEDLHRVRSSRAHVRAEDELATCSDRP
jgi:hypothetical protein